MKKRKSFIPFPVIEKDPGKIFPGSGIRHRTVTSPLTLEAVI